MINKQDRSARVSRSSLTMVWRVLVFAIWLPITTPVLANAESAHFDIVSQPLPAALQAFATQARMQLLYEQAAVMNAVGNPVSGDLDTRVALEQLLRGTGLEIIYSSDNAATIRLARANPDKGITKEQKTKSTERDVGPAQFDSLGAKDK